MHDERTRRTRMWLEAGPPPGRPQERQPLTSVPHEQVELAKALYKLSVHLPGFVARVVPGDVTTTQWLTLANALAAIAEQCRRQVPREVLDIGDSGGR
jgi:hypothetical protein